MLILVELGRSMFKLFQHPSTAIVKGAGMVMKAVIEVNSDHYTMFLFECVKIIEKAIFKMFENSE